MNILIVTQYFWPENFRVNDLCQGLKERGHHVTVFTGMPNYPQGKIYKDYSFWKGPFKEDWDGVTIYRIPMIPRGKKIGLQLIFNYLSFALWGSLIIPFLFLRKNVDKIFVFQVSPITAALPAITLSKLKGAPVYLWVTDLWPDTLVAAGIIKGKLLYGLVNIFVKWVYRNVHHILVATKGFKDKVSNNGTKKEKVTFFPQWAESLYTQTTISDQLPNQKIPESGFKVMFAGNLGTSQALDVLVEAAEKIKEQNIQWLILGDGIKKEWMVNEVAKRGLTESFHFLGTHPVELMPSFYAKADALIISLKKAPIFSMTIPGKMASCLASGKPIIASLDGEGAEIVSTAQCGLVSASHDSQQLSANILKLSQTPKEELREMGTNAKKYFLENFEREKLLSQLENVMNTSSEVSLQ